MFLVVIVNWVTNSDMFECSKYMTSVCSNNVVSKWNKDNVGKSLQQWVKSISIEKLHEKASEYGDKNQDDRSNAKKSKTVTITRNDVCSQLDFDLYSPNIIILTKITHDDKNWEPTNQTLYGVILPTITDPYELYINDTEGEISGLYEEAKFHLGLYYGILNIKI